MHPRDGQFTCYKHRKAQKTLQDIAAGVIKAHTRVFLCTLHFQPFKKECLILNQTYRHCFHPFCQTRKLSDTFNIAVSVMHVPLTLYPITRYTLNPSQQHKLYPFPAETRFLMVKFSSYSQYDNIMRLTVAWSLRQFITEQRGVLVILVDPNLHLTLPVQSTLTLSIRYPILK
jgi:hypothetical protein